MSYGLYFCEDDDSRRQWLVKKAYHDAGTISMIATVAGTAVSAYSQAQQGKTANMFAQRNAQIQTRNAQIAQQNAEFNAKLKEREDRRRRSSQVAGLQGSGVEIFEGTNLIAMAEQEFVDDLNAQLLRRGGTIEAQNLRMQADITSAQGKAAEQAGYMGAAGSLLTGAGQAGTDYYTLKQQQAGKIPAPKPKPKPKAGSSLLRN